MKSIPSMRQEIFKAGFSTNTISVYLAICGFIDSGMSVSIKALLDIWSETRESLIAGIKELEEKKIIFVKSVSDDGYISIDNNVSLTEDEIFYGLSAVQDWKVIFNKTVK